MLVSLPDNPVPMRRHAFPSSPWVWVANDLLGPFPNNEHLLVLIDYWRSEWEVWLRDSKKRNKLLHLGGSQLHSVVYNLPGAMVPYIPEERNDVFTPLVEKLNDYFSPIRNSVFERHLYRGMTPRGGECSPSFLCDCVSR